MTNKLISDYVDIDQCPIAEPADNNCQITIGDLHGNAVKYLYLLVRHGVVKKDPVKYQRFVQIYRKPTASITVEELAEIKKICHELEVVNKPLIRFIGDKYADRGQNDYFTLLLDDKLDQEKVPREDIHSNHDHTLVESYEKKQPFRSSHQWGSRQFAASMHNMQDLIEAGKLKREEITALINKAYLPHSKLLSYNIDSNDEITLFSHARIDEDIIFHLAAKMNVPFLAETVHELAATIDAINDKYQNDYVKKGLIHSLPINLMSKTKDDPVTFMMWSREYHLLKEYSRKYKINSVHGHDSAGPKNEDIFCLDNQLGNSLANHSGQYQVLVSSQGLKKEDKVEIKAEVKAEVKIEDNNQAIHTQQEPPLTHRHPKAVSNEISDQAHTKLKMQFSIMEKLRDELTLKSANNPNYIKAAQVAKNFCDNLQASYKMFCDQDEKNAHTYNVFRKAVKNEIKLASIELENYRGWKQVCFNVITSVIIIGLILGVINYAITGRFWLFRTASAEKLEDFKENIKTILPKKPTHSE